MSASIPTGPARIDEAGEIAALVADAYREYVPLIGREPAPMRADHAQLIADGSVTVARIDGAIVGVIVTEPRVDHLHIGNLAVSPSVQGRGIGSVLLDFAERQARALGLDELRLYTNAAMTENIAYYLKRGYREVDRRTDDGFDRVFFIRPLENPG